MRISQPQVSQVSEESNLNIAHLLTNFCNKLICYSLVNCSSWPTALAAKKSQRTPIDTKCRASKYLVQGILGPFSSGRIEKETYTYTHSGAFLDGISILEAFSALLELLVLLLT